MNIASLLKSGLAVGILALSGSVSVWAQAPAATPNPANAKVSGKEYVLTHTSNFQPLPNGQRNPFWPIGWTPSAPVAAAAAGPVLLDVRADQFVVTSISLDAPALAVVNGKTRGVGDRIPVSADSKDFVLVKQIVDGAVVLDYHGHELRATSGGGAGARKP